MIKLIIYIKNFKILQKNSMIFFLMDHILTHKKIFKINKLQKKKINIWRSLPLMYKILSLFSTVGLYIF